MYVDPSHDLGVLIPQQIALGVRRFQLSNDLYLSSPFSLDSNCEIEGSGSTVIEYRGPNVSASLADVRSNAFVRASGKIDTSFLNTTLSAHAKKGDTAIQVVNPGLLKPGDWLALIGHNSAAGGHSGIDGASSQSVNITLTELAQVSSSYVSGSTTIPLTAALQQYHTITNGGAGTPCSVKGVVPVKNVRIEGVCFSAEGGTVATGVLAEYSSRLVLDIEGTGFSRSLGEIVGSRELRLDRVHSRGECNAAMIFDSVVESRVGEITSSASGKRFHANGIPRAGVVYYNRCTSITHRLVDIRRHVRAGLVLNGVDLSFGHVHGNDLDLSEADVRDPSNALAAFWQQGTSPLADVEFSIGQSYGLMTWQNARVPDSNELQCALFLHDVHGLLIGSVRGGNEEASPNQAPYANGIWYQDVDGSMGLIYVNGVRFAAHFRGAYANMVIGSIEYAGASGSGVAADAGLFINYGGGLNKGPRILAYRYSNVGSPFLTGSDWNGALEKDWNLCIPYVDADGVVYQDCVIARNKTGGSVVSGTNVEIDPASAAGERDLILPAGNPSRACKVVTPGANNSFVLVGRLNAIPIGPM